MIRHIPDEYLCDDKNFEHGMSNVGINRHTGEEALEELKRSSTIFNFAKNYDIKDIQSWIDAYNEIKKQKDCKYTNAIKEFLTEVAKKSKELSQKGGHSKKSRKSKSNKKRRTRTKRSRKTKCRK
jgi:hypothetical protein